ncbi:hypothetical protein M2323_002767 [Rhodoblastus acidophilus]|uniref:DUF2239 family protein n=1 Tax=Rhodoblastus acidophilus TaxID=1074 RepID=UPI002224DDE5|nr:DUF2239 family protein [Rhodoblastus acidophilus]MCW2284879.1 hypothetical protein [Rhodoblastus acidophilus]MCW2333831.1 hypothetical protein [Rhodoblastus acidophilus]
MSISSTNPSTAFAGEKRLFSGPLGEVALAVKAASEVESSHTILVFDDATGRVIDLDLRGSEAEVLGRLSPPEEEAEAAESEPQDGARGRGRPKLGVVAREVTLLPRQWEWLSTQPGGASAVLRRLVDDARRKGEAGQRRRAAQEAAYRFMLAIAGDRPGYEEATRALFAGDRLKLAQDIADWPEDIRAHIMALAFGAGDAPPSP